MDLSITSSGQRPHPSQQQQQVSGNGYDFSLSVESFHSQSGFSFGLRDSQSLTVDQTLATLFDTLTVECSGVLVQPQWKHFRHIRMLKNDQIRLSNGIWRSWHLQFQKVKAPLYCRFVIDAKLDHHKRQEAIVLEGKYWKRKESAVATEYRKWRLYYHKANKSRKHDPSLDSVREKASKAFAEFQSRHTARPPQDMQIDPPRPLFLQNYNDFPDSLLSLMDTAPVYSSSEVVLQQPNLDMLNPMLDDFLNRLEPMDVALPRSAMSGVYSGGYSTPPQPHTSTPPQPHTFTSSTRNPQPSVSFSQPLVTPSLESQTTPLSQLATPTQKPQTPPQQAQPPYPATFSPSPQMEPFVGRTMRQASGLEQEAQQYSVSPTSFLNLPPSVTQPGRVEPTGMDVGMNFPMKQEPVLEDGSRMASSGSTNQNSCLYRPTLPGYQQVGESQEFGSINRNPSDDIFSLQASLQHKVNDMEGAFGGPYVQTEATLPSIQPSPLDHTHPQSSSMQPQGNEVFQFPNSNLNQSSPTNQYPAAQQSLPRDHMTEMFTHPQPFVRVSSAGNLGLVADTASPLPHMRPPLERGKSEPIRRLHEQVQKLSAENEKQLMEIDKQKNFAEKQYSELLQTVMHQQTASGKTSEQQQQVLQSVLADPSLVGILRSVLLTTPPPSGAVGVTDGPSTSQDLSGVGFTTPGKMSLTELHMKSGHVTGHVTSPLSGGDLTSPPNIVSPTDLAKVTGVSDFQSRLLVAAASQVAQTSSFTAGSSAAMSPYYLSGGSDSETTPSGSSISQLRLKPTRKLNTEEKEAYKEFRRQSHISAEQKRRGSIKQGFDHLQSLVVNISSYPSGKVSKAVVLEKTIEHIRHIHNVRTERERRTEALRKEIEDLNLAIAHCQEMLPASGVPVTRQRFEENRQRFRDYVQRRTQQNYKFWIFSIILKQLFGSYNSMVSTGSVDELCRTVLAWFEQNCTLPALRPVVMSSLRELSQKTSILTDPSLVPRQLAQYAQQEMQLHRQEQEKARTNRVSFS